MKRTEQHVVEISHAVEYPCHNPGESHAGEIGPPFRTFRKWLAFEVEDDAEASP